MNLEDVLLRGTAAARPAVATVAEGTLYFSTDTLALEQARAGAWVNYSPAVDTVYTVGVTIDGGGSVLTTGVKGYRSIPMSGLITKARVLAKESGNIVFDVWRDTYANYPPTVADTITAAAKPTLTGAQKSEDTTLTGWSRTVVAGEILGFNIDSVATITRATLELEITT